MTTTGRFISMTLCFIFHVPRFCFSLAKKNNVN